MSRLPTLFISHGAPDLPIKSGAAQDFLRQLHDQFPKPNAILMVSAHWNTTSPAVSTALQPKTIHDFSGFPADLYQLSYPVAGAPELAERVRELLQSAGFTTVTHPTRGLDHGAWTPLSLVYPDADVPVTQLSIQDYQGPNHHWQLGRALAPLRDAGILIVGSGAVTHNLWAFDPVYTAQPPYWVEKFDTWIAESIDRMDIKALLNYRQMAAYAQENHPTEEHLLPLFVALGAAGENAKGTQLHSSYTYGAFSMAAYRFD